MVSSQGRRSGSTATELLSCDGVLEDTNIGASDSEAAEIISQLGKDVAEQSELIWHNIREILVSAGMEITDIVKMTAYLLEPADVVNYAPVKSKYLGEHRPASTLIYVSALATPEVAVEVEVIAARVD